MFNIFELHGYFTKEQVNEIDRFSKTLTHFCSYDIFNHPKYKNISSYSFINPLESVDTSKENTVLSFYRKSASPYLSNQYLKYTLNEFSHYKSQILIELLACGADVNLSDLTSVYISSNEATLKGYMLQAETFYDETNQIFYYTYLKDNDLHIVWIENTQTIMSKASMILKSGYKGIFIRNPILASQGNWEAMHLISGLQ